MVEVAGSANKILFLLLTVQLTVTAAMPFAEDDTNDGGDSIRNQPQIPECVNATLLPHECSAIHFYRCLNGHKLKMRCPEGRFFDPERLVCDWPPRGSCKVVFSEDCTPTSVYFPDYDDPTAFYQCSNGEFYKFQCPAELVFNRQLNVCDWPRRNGTVYQPKINRVNCYTGNCEQNASMITGNDTFRPSDRDVNGFFITKDGWTPVVGARPSMNEERKPDYNQDNKNYPTQWRWPARSATDLVTSTTMATRKNDKIEKNDSDGQALHLLTASTGTARTPVGWLQAKPWSDTDSVIEVSRGRRVQVSIDTSIGVVDVSNNATDYTIHFQPNSEFENKTLSTNVVIGRDGTGVVTLKGGVRADEDSASFTVKIRRT